MNIIDDSVKVYTSINDCKSIWKCTYNDDSIFSNWEIREELACICGVTPFFLVNKDTVLPIGVQGNKLIFFGGKIYSERNGFLGNKAGSKNIFKYLINGGYTMRLLSWFEDPINLLPSNCLELDKKYNQYWLFNPAGGLSEYFIRQGKSFERDYNYIFRRFDIQIRPFNVRSDPELIQKMIIHTNHSFAKRGKKSAYNDHDVCILINSMITRANQIYKTKIIEVFRDDEIVSIGVIIEHNDKESVYLLNLYKPEINLASNAVVAGVTRYSFAENRIIDGLRGSFGLKKKFGFEPTPSYAIVSDTSWVDSDTYDIECDTLIKLYGREFGANFIGTKSQCKS